MLSNRIPFAVTVILALAASVVTAQSYDPSTAFSPSDNPNGVWSYGYSLTLGSPMMLHSDRLNVSGVDVWRTDIAWGDPLVMHNGTSNTVDLFTAVRMAPGELGMHPGPNGEIAVLRFSPPEPGQYEVQGSFFGLDTWGTSTDVHILANGLSIFDGTVTGFGPGTGPSFSTTAALGPGSYLDFAVGYGPNNTFWDDSTGLSAQITMVPEPSITLLGLSGGLFLWALVFRKRTRS